MRDWLETSVVVIDILADLMAWLYYGTFIELRMSMDGWMMVVSDSDKGQFSRADQRQ